MPRTTILGDYIFKGWYLLDAEDLRELDSVLAKVRKELARHASERLRKAVDDHLKRETPGTPEEVRTRQEEVLRQLKDRYPHCQKEQSVTMELRSSRKVVGGTFQEVMDNPELSRDSPKNATAEIKEGDSSVKITIFPIWDWNASTIRLSVEPDGRSISKRIRETLSEWVTSKQRPTYWESCKTLVGIVGLNLLLVVWPALLAIARSETTGSDALKQEARQLCEHGIDSSNQTQAIELVLRLQTANYRPGVLAEKKEPPTYPAVPVLAVGLMLYGLFGPKSVLGVGRSHRRLQYQRFLIRSAKWLFGFFAVSILATGFRSWLIEAIRTRL